MNIPELSERQELFVSIALAKIEKEPELTSQKALSMSTTLRFPQQERSKMLRSITLRRKPKPKWFRFKKNQIDAKRNDLHQRKMLGEEF